MPEEIVPNPNGTNPEQIDLKKLRQNIFDYVFADLAGEIVDVELDTLQYDKGLEQAISVYRTRSSNAVEESYAFMTLLHDQQEYILPQEITHVKQIYRRTIGSMNNNDSSLYDPFEAAFVNTYLLTAGQPGGLLSFELYSGYLDLTARMFGGYINFTFNIVTKKLSLVRRPRGGGEIIMLHTYNLKPEAHLLSDYRIQNFLKIYTSGWCRRSLGEAREKFGQLAGPQGGTSLNGSALKSEGQIQMDKAVDGIGLYQFGETPISFIFG